MSSVSLREILSKDGKGIERRAIVCWDDDLVALESGVGLVCWQEKGVSFGDPLDSCPSCDLPPIASLFSAWHAELCEAQEAVEPSYEQC